ncbi:MAG TPA: hypothetical protein VGP24_10965, partial [Glaciihabitans sp.]|nr:hypothetical protein [Glaciihabitans sp.]
MRRKRFSWAAIVAIVAIAGSVLVSTPNQAEAAVASNFDPGYIISDEVFFNGGAMSQGAIQSFFESKVPNCAAGSQAPCLRDYYQSTTTIAASANCSTYKGAANERASTIIYKVAVACGINPQVLIVLLQKEQGLVTSTTATDLRYRKAMGYGCPDTASCDAQFYGFFNQVFKSAWQFKQYTNSPNRAYKIGKVAIAYHPYNTSCGAPVVNIRNQATANLYNYTPYQPNKAAMANLNGLGDSCSAYGNRNFWVYFSDWFGSPTGGINPIGAIDRTTVGGDAVWVTGWALDPNTNNSIAVHAYLDGKGVAVTANGSRPDVAAAYGKGADHGFSVKLPLRSRKSQQLCIYGINEGPGANSAIRCSTITPKTGSPTGVLDSVKTAVNEISVSGWALDPDTGASISTHVYVDSASVAVTANKARPDIAAIYPGYGDKKGFSTKISATPGQHNVCAYAINVGAGSNKLMNCKTVTVPAAMDPSPIGVLDGVSASGGTVTARGWALDPDTNNPISVHLYVGSASTAHKAGESRPDI